MLPPRSQSWLVFGHSWSHCQGTVPAPQSLLHRPWTLPHAEGRAAPLVSQVLPAPSAPSSLGSGSLSDSLWFLLHPHLTHCPLSWVLHSCWPHWPPPYFPGLPQCPPCRSLATARNGRAGGEAGSCAVHTHTLICPRSLIFPLNSSYSHPGKGLLT